MHTLPEGVYGCVYILDGRDGEHYYVGQTTTPDKRYRGHLRDVESDASSHKVNWLKKLVRECRPMPIMDVVEYANDLDEVLAEEAKWDAALKEMGINPINYVAGNASPMSNPEVAAKISGENSPTKRPEVRAKISAAARQPERLAKISGENSPTKRPEVRAKISAANMGENNPMKRPEVRAKQLAMRIWNSWHIDMNS